MSGRSTIQRFVGAVLTVLAIGMLIVPAAQAKDVPIYIEYTGTGHDLVPPSLDPLADNIVIADAKGSFGAKSTVFVVKFYEETPPTSDFCPTGYDYFGIDYARAVTSFQEGSQIFAAVIPGTDSYMCLNQNTGHYDGSVVGVFIGGVGRFANASGSFVSPFEGQNLTSATLNQFPFRSIKGSFEGVVTTP